MALADGIEDQVQVAKAAWEAAAAAEQRARDHKETLEVLIENAENGPPVSQCESEYPVTNLSLEDWLDQLEIPQDYIDSIPNGRQCNSRYVYTT